MPKNSTSLSICSGGIARSLARRSVRCAWCHFAIAAGSDISGGVGGSPVHSNLPCRIESANQTSEIARWTASSQALRDFGSGLKSRLPFGTAASTLRVAVPSDSIVPVSSWTIAVACSAFMAVSLDENATSLPEVRETIDRDQQVGRRRRRVLRNEQERRAIGADVIVGQPRERSRDVASLEQRGRHAGVQGTTAHVDAHQAIAAAIE